MNTEYKTALAQFKSDIKVVTSLVKEKNAMYSREDYTIEDCNQLKVRVNEATNGKAEVVFDDRARRHFHVAYALLKGRSLDQIEQKSRKKLYVSWIKNYIKKYTGSDALADSFSEETGRLNRDVLMVSEVVG